MNFYFAIASPVSSAARFDNPRQTTQKIKPRNPDQPITKSRFNVVQVCVARALLPAKPDHYHNLNGQQCPFHKPRAMPL
jgi:hypothetical protein